MNAPRQESHDETVVKLLKADPDFSNAYLAAALEEAELPGGQTALLAALRHIVEAKGIRPCLKPMPSAARINPPPEQRTTTETAQPCTVNS